MYLLLLTTNGKRYIALTEDYSIQAFKTIDEVVSVFNGYHRFYDMGKKTEVGKNRQFSGSATIGMCNLAPKAIEFNHPATELENYIVNMTPVKVWGGVLGKGYIGVEVKEEMVNFPSTDIWGIILERVYGQQS